MPIRMRTDFDVLIDGKVYSGSTNMRDQVNLKKVVKNPTGDGEDLTRLVMFACQRLGYFEGTWDEFLDVCEDISITAGDELPPLVQAPSTDK